MSNTRCNRFDYNAFGIIAGAVHSVHVAMPTVAFSEGREYLVKVYEGRYIEG